MTAPRDSDRLIHGFLLEGEEYLQDQVYDEVRAAIEHKRQRAVFGPWRTPIMNKFVSYGLAAVAVVAVLLVGYQLIGRPSNTGQTGDPTPTPEASVAEPSPSTAADLDEGPFVLPGEEPITVMIPAPGWYSDDGIPMKNGNNQPPDGAYVFGPFRGQDALYVSGDPCQWESTMPDTHASTVDEIVGALASQASRDASEPVDITVDGYTGKSITLHVPDDVTHTSDGFTGCDQDQFCTFGDGTDCMMWNAQGPGAIDELWIVDVDGQILLVTGAYYPETPAEDVDELQAILRSMTFGE